MRKNAYKEYNTSMTTSQFRSTSEQLLENYLESRDDVDWYYKNGDTGQQYLIRIRNNLSKGISFLSRLYNQKEKWRSMDN